MGRSPIHFLVAPCQVRLWSVSRAIGSVRWCNIHIVRIVVIPQHSLKLSLFWMPPTNYLRWEIGAAFGNKSILWNIIIFEEWWRWLLSGFRRESEAGAYITHTHKHFRAFLVLAALKHFAVLLWGPSHRGVSFSLLPDSSDLTDGGHIMWSDLVPAWHGGLLVSGGARADDFFPPSPHFSCCWTKGGGAQAGGRLERRASGAFRCLASCRLS